MIVPRAPYHIPVTTVPIVVAEGEKNAISTQSPIEKKLPISNAESTVGSTPERNSAPQILPQKAIPMHQPFKQEFQKLSTDGTSKEVVNGNRETKIERPQQKATMGAPQSLLKSQPKKDKGPSAENMSGLKAALDAAMRGNAGQGGVSVATQIPESGIPSQRMASTSPQEKPSGVTKTEEKIEKPIPENKPRVLLDDIVSPITPHEVPEDVLRGVLAD